MKKNKIFLLISIFITCTVFWYLFTQVSLADVSQLIKGVDKKFIVVFVVLSLFGSFFRTWRYALLLRSLGWKASNAALYCIVIIRNFFSDLLPARLGTLAYVFLVNNRLGVPLTSATATFAISFLFDIIALFPILLLAIFLHSTIAFSKLTVAAVALATLTISALLLYLLPVIAKKIATLLEQQLRFPQIPKLLHTFSQELDRCKESGIYWQVLLLSVMVRVCKYGSLIIFLIALLVPLGYQPHEISLSSALIGVLLPEVSSSLPISGIAGFGLYEGTWAYIFGVLGYPQGIANVTAVAHHLFTQLYGWGLGVAALCLLAFPFYTKANEVSTKNVKTNKKSSLQFSSKIVTTTLLLCIFAYAPFVKNQAQELSITSGNSQSSSRTKLESPSDPLHFDVTSEEIANAQIGKIIFDSNLESNNFGIYAANIDRSAITKVYDSKMHDMFPDISPNGELIVFTKARSTSRFDPGEIWLIQSDGTNPRLLVNNGQFPTFSDDGSTIFFERARKKVLKISVNGGKAKEIFPKKTAWGRYQVVKPRISSDENKIAFTSDRKGMWNAWFVNLEQKQWSHIAQGCEPTWRKNQNQLAYIKKGDVQAGSGIYSYDPITKQHNSLEDADGKRGHEYFPTITKDGSYLLYSATSQDQHSHETANYEVMIKDLKTGERHQVTANGSTNRWPKLMQKN